jgi:type IV pilus assembly protein PilV
MIVKKQSPDIPRSRRDQGYMMVEVLVTILVVSLGMFGILAVIINSLKLSSSSNYRTVAAQQATAMADTLRANPTTIGYNSAIPVPGDCSLNVPGACSFSNLSLLTASASDTCFKSAGCSRSTFVNTTFRTWRTNLAAILPSGDGTICRDSAPATNLPTFNLGTGVWSFGNCSGTGPYVVKVCWGESNIRASAATSLGGMMCTWTAI